MIHARLDTETERMLRRLGRQFGWSESQVVRECIKLLNGLNARRRRLKGLGRFDSGVPDLGSNKGYLKGFGR